MSKDRAAYLASGRHKTMIGQKRKADAELAEKTRQMVSQYLNDGRASVSCFHDLCEAVNMESKR